MYCLKCGKKMNDNDRNCFSCGALNPMHPDNKEFMQENPNALSENSSDATKVIDISDGIEKSYELSYNKTCFIIVNLIFYLTSIFLVYISSSMSLKALNPNSSVLISILLSFFVVTYVYMYFISYEKLLIKARLPWWGMFIPLYNIILLFKLAFGNIKPFIILTVLTVFISVILGVGIFLGASGNVGLAKTFLNLSKFLGTIYGFVSFIIEIAYFCCLGSAFGRSGILMLLFNFVLVPVAAFSDKWQYER